MFPNRTTAPGAPRGTTSPTDDGVRARRRTLLAAFAATAATASLGRPRAAFAQPMVSPQPGFVPEVGQSGKDVIWVPTPDALVARMLRMARVTGADFVIDLGAGDGRIAIAAARDFRARARGIEYNPDMVELSRRNAAAAGVADRVEFRRADLFQTDLDEASVITMYLLPSINMKLRPKLLELRPGTRIVSHAFDLGDWVADETAKAENRVAYLWIVPARLEGTWVVEHPGRSGVDRFELNVKQTFQRIEGTVRRGNRLGPFNGTLSGDRIRFGFPDGEGNERVYAGRIVDDRMEGRTRTQGGTDIGFTATRK
jgi:methylase of polypeptide subunit release factors